MALVGSAYENDWQWTTAGDAEDEVAPVTSRSPAFVGVAPSETRHREPLESLVVLAEPAVRHESGIMPIVREPDPWSERQVSLSVAALQLEETANGASKAAVELIADVTAIDAALRGLVVRLGDDAGGLLAHAYEWATNLLTRADAALGGGVSFDDLPVDEYSSLFVRTILDPMLDAAVVARARAKDERAVEELSALRESIFWANVTAKRLA
jgi:hypothetical protein